MGKKDKQGVNAKKGSLFLINPEELYIMGLDGNDGPEWLNHAERNVLPLSEEFLSTIPLVRGLTDTVEATKIGPIVYVFKGRQRVKHLREHNRRVRARHETGEPVDLEKELFLAPTRMRREKPHVLMAIDLASNHHHQELSAIQRARCVQAFVEGGGTRAEACSLIGMSDQAVGQCLALLDLSPEAIDAIDMGELAASAGTALRSATYTEQLNVVEKAKEQKETTGKRMTTRQVKGGIGASSRPGIKRIRQVIKDQVAAQDFLAALRWVVGDASEEEVGLVGP